LGSRVNEAIDLSKLFCLDTSVFYDRNLDFRNQSFSELPFLPTASSFDDSVVNVLEVLSG